MHYAATKAGVDALTLGLAKELGPDGVRVNAVAPGDHRHRDARRDGRPGACPADGVRRSAGARGRAEEIAAAIAWLMSPDASYTTGTVLEVAGGR